jgi:NAD(P)-dependent dehydrogenase (short-subunit alcohol dehydrogenase family)
VTRLTRDRVAVVTGSSSGIGKAAAKALAARGWRVIGLGRDAERCANARTEITAASAPGVKVDVIQADFSLMADAATAADRVIALTDRIDVLINNAGGVGNQMRVTPEGIEATFAGNHLGPFLFTTGLLPILQATAAVCTPGDVRIIAVSSIGHHNCPGIDWDDLQRTRNYARSTHRGRRAHAARDRQARQRRLQRHSIRSIWLPRF